MANLDDLNKIEQKVKSIVCDVLGLEEHLVSASSHLKEDLEASRSETIDIFDREAVFIEKVLLGWMIPNFPGLKIVLEHTTTANGVDFVKESGENIAATITPHHLIINRNDISIIQY